MCVLPSVVATKIQFIQFNVCYLVLFVCLLAFGKQAYKQHQVTHIELNELNEHTNNTTLN